MSRNDKRKMRSYITKLNAYPAGGKLSKNIRALNSAGVKNYRADIDGLRAIAILAVVIYHAFPELPLSGFIGVDIFFVISGYLISGHITQSLNVGEFSFLKFYQRRILRLFPALVTVLFAALFAGLFTLNAVELDGLSQHLLASSLFVQNFFLESESGYFDSSAEKKILLHLWSLSVEEQFYFVWPMFMAMLYRFKAKPGFFISAVAIVSFFLCIHELDQPRRFYFPQFRFWELALGAFLSSVHQKLKLGYVNFTWLVEKGGFGVVGVLLVLFGLVYISEKDFPSALTILPVLGSGLILLSGENSFTNKYLLGNPVLAWVGKISYPLYLWHWPLFAFTHILFGETPSSSVRAVLVILSFVAAHLTQRYIETPLRFGSNRKRITIGLIFFTVCLAAAGWGVHAQKGMPDREANSIVEKKSGDIGHDVFHDLIDKTYYPCQPLDVRADALSWGEHLRCQQSKNHEENNLAILGDSHAEHIFLGVAEALPDLNSVYYIKGGWPYFENPHFSDIYRTIIEDKSISFVIVAAYWKMYFDMVRDQDRDLSVFTEQLSSSIDFLVASGKSIILLDDVPDFPFDPEKCKYSRLIGNSRCSVSKLDYTIEREEVDRVLSAVVSEHESTYLFESFDLFCSKKLCSMADDNGQILYRDRNHLNVNGSRFLGKSMAEFIRKLAD